MEKYIKIGKKMEEIINEIPDVYIQQIKTPIQKQPTKLKSEWMKQFVTDKYYFLNTKTEKIKTEKIKTEKIKTEKIKTENNNIRKDFPLISNRKVNSKKLVWFDNGATTQKPQKVIDAINRFYTKYNSNIHRGSHTLANESTDAYEKVRKKVADFIGSSEKEVIFTKGTTEGINLIANSFGNMIMKEGDTILVTEMEHHANIVPWMMLESRLNKKIKVDYINITDKGELNIIDFKKKIKRAKIFAVTYISNVLSTINNIKGLIQIAKKYGSYVLVDMAQSIAHKKINVKELDIDFCVFSGHKMYGPSGVGILYGKHELLEIMPPWQGGGGMIKDVTFDKIDYNDIPEKFEAGTSVLASAIGLGYAIDYIKKIGWDKIQRHEKKLNEYGMKKLKSIKGLTIYGNSKQRIPTFSFSIIDHQTGDMFDPHSISKYLNKHGIAVRSGHHCALPTLRHFGLESVVRASLAIYNTTKEIDYMVNVLKQYISEHKN
jgi:cysteine desulfurase/selenocysteine lyase